MATHVALLRGINLGKVNRIPMARLREVLAEAGHRGAVTHLQSGNVVLRSGDSPKQVASAVERAIEQEWGLEIPVIVRSRARLAKVVEADPFGCVADDPARYLVTFLAGKPRAKALDDLDPAAFEPERFELRGSELYTWLPGGVHESQLMKALSKRPDDLVGTARNWRTVTKLLELTAD